MLVLLFGSRQELYMASKTSSHAENQLFGIERVLQMLENVGNKDGDVIIIE